MVLAVKVSNPQMDLANLALVGLNRYRQASHTRDYPPERIEISLEDKAKINGTYTIGGVPILINEDLKPGELRVCTADIEGVED